MISTRSRVARKMAKRTADTELMKSETKNVCIRPRSNDGLQDVVHKARVIKEEDLSDSPISLVAIDEDALLYHMLYWPADELVGLRVLRYLADPNRDIGVISALMCLCIEHFTKFYGKSDSELLCKKFDVKDVKELGILRELVTDDDYDDDDDDDRSKNAKNTGKVKESDLNPARYTILMHCYEWSLYLRQ